MNYADDMITVITPVYNSEKYIGDSIKSVLAQTYENWEMLIADDCSKDGTAEVVRSFNDPRIKYFKLPINSGAARARNFILERARGRFIAFLDADDTWKPEKLQRQLDFMAERAAGFSFTSYCIVKDGGDRVIKVPAVLNYTQFMKNSIIGTLTVMIDRSIVGDVRMVDVKKDHDSMTWASILKTGVQAHGLNESMAFYRIVKDSISYDKMQAVMNHWKNCRNIEKIGRIRCAYYMAHYLFNAVKKHYL